MTAALTPSIAVVIPTHNRADCIMRAVDSVLTSGCEGLEVIVVDDGSTDATPEIQAQCRDRRFTAIRLPERAGANHARNVGAAASRAPILAFLDSDDVFEPGRPERLVRLFADEPDIDAALDGFWVVTDRERGLARLPHTTMTGPALAHLLITHAIGLTNSAVTVRREAFDAIGGFDRDLYRH
jgi:glycosyltransferase involved in cell wall biosynthesis